jgi:hypothetical protein
MTVWTEFIVQWGQKYPPQADGTRVRGSYFLWGRGLQFEEASGSVMQVLCQEPEVI